MFEWKCSFSQQDRTHPYTNFFKWFLVLVRWKIKLSFVKLQFWVPMLCLKNMVALDQNFANVFLSYHWYQPLGRFKSICKMSARSHAKQLRYWVKKLLFQPLAQALSDTLRTNKKIWDLRFCHRCPKFFLAHSVQPVLR